jgi:hypothetical protein
VPTTASTPSGSPTVAKSICRKIGIRALPGGASRGQEIAAIQFTNESTASCYLAGYPTVTLLRGGRMIGKVSRPASTAPSGRTLAPGEVAESLLHDYVMNCQAPLSDTIRVVAPGSNQTYSRPMQLRACVLRLDRLGAPD